jgi:Family of unknown function (DUF5681)
MGLLHGSPMSENKRDYAVGRGKPPVHTRFKKGQSGNPRGPRPKNLPALLIDALDEPVMATIDGEQRETTKREAVVTQLVNKSAAADLRAIKMLVDMLKDAEKKPVSHHHPSPPPSPRPTRRSWRPPSPGCANPGRRSFGSFYCHLGEGRDPCGP